MSSKRQATTDLNHDNWDQELEAEEAGEFKKATIEGLKNRVIKKARRSIPTAKKEGETPSPFAGFSGFSAVSKPTTNNFSAFTMPKTDSLNPSKNQLFSFGSTSTEPISMFPSSDTKKFMMPQPEEKSEPKLGATTLNFGGPMKGSLFSKEPIIASSIKSATSTTPTSTTANEDNLLKKLNASVIDWIQTHFEADPYCDFTPVFNDYKDHLKGIFGEGQSAVSKPDSSPLKTNGTKTRYTPALFKSSPGTIPQLIDSPGFSAMPIIPEEPKTTSPFSQPFSMSSSMTIPSADTSPHTKFSVFSASENKPTFSFTMNTPKDPAPQSHLPNLLSEKPEFSFGLANPVVPSKQEKEETEDETPPEPEKAFVEDDFLYTIRCKLFYKKDGTYIVRGIGNLFLKKMENGKVQLVVRSDTVLGTMFLNIVLSSGLPIQRSEKNNVLLITIPNPKIEGMEGAVSFLIRVKTVENADELFQKLTEYKEKD